MTAHGRIVIQRRELAGLDAVAAYAVEAMPAFIAFAGARGAFGASPDLVLSGINRGPNTGRAILHSGTVGAAMTAATSGVQSVAFSLDVRRGDAEPEWATAAAVAAEDHVQVSMTELGGQAEPGSDSALLADGYASVTALRPVCEASASWLDVWQDHPERAAARPLFGKSWQLTQRGPIKMALTCPNKTPPLGLCPGGSIGGIRELVLKRVACGDASQSADQ